MVDDLEDLPQYSSPRAPMIVLPLDAAAARRLLPSRLSCGDGHAPTA
ncbi:MAG TPA: hypothetical protein VLI21_02175 [Casimicrobiaceae bacterium]|nr:hypothetical protein [Casimicrobiaceae bacterium]